MITLPECPQERGDLPSASALHRLIACPGSWRAEQRIPEPPQSADAARGTALHKHMELGTFPDDPADLAAVTWCREQEQQLVTAYLGTGAAIVARERRLWCSESASDTPLFSGQADVIYASADEKRFLIIDYKFGRGEVTPAESNAQLAALAVLLAASIGPIIDTGEVGTIYAAILQPAVGGSPRVTKYSDIQLGYAYKTLEENILAAREEDAPLRPRIAACRYCRAAAVCPAALRDTLAARDVISAWPTLAPQQKRSLWDSSRPAKQAVASIEAAAKADLAAGLTIPGLTISEGKTQFKITSANAAYNALAADMGLTAADFASCCTVSMEKLDALVHAKLKARATARGETWTEVQSRTYLRDLLRPHATVTTTAGSIKEETK